MGLIRPVRSVQGLRLSSEACRIVFFEDGPFLANSLIPKVVFVWEHSFSEFRFYPAQFFLYSRAKRGI